MGCVSLTTTLDHDVRRGDLRVHFESATGMRPPDAEHRQTRETRVDLTVEQVPGDVTLIDANLASREVAPCFWSHVASVGRSGGRWASAPLQVGERLTLGFAAGAFETIHEDSPRIDLLLETPEKHLRCFPLPVADEGRPLRWEVDQHLAFGFGVSVEGFASALGSVTQVGTFPLTVGYWLGPYRIEVTPGVALAGCLDTRCAVTGKDVHISNRAVLSLSAGVARELFEFSILSFGAAVRYRAVHLAANTFQGQEQLWMHGPVLAPYVGIVPPIALGGGGPREFLLGFEVPVGYAFAQNGDQTVTIGFGLTMLATVL